MPHQPIRSGRPELQLRVRLVAEEQPHLAQAEQIEVIDEEGRDEDERPAEAEQAEENGAPDRIADRPDHGAKRPASMAMPFGSGTVAAPSSAVGTTKPPTKPMA